MILSVEPIYVIWFAGLLLAFLGALAGTGRWLLNQFQRRIDDRFSLLAEDTKQWRAIERDLLMLRAELPQHYVRREDYIRGQSVLEAKMDSLFSKMEAVRRGDS